MKYTLWLRWRRRPIVVQTAMLFFVLSAHAQDTVIPAVGGPGGEFVGRCPPGKLLGGVELTTHYWVEAIRPLCSTPSVNGIATATTGWYGRNAGSIGRSLVCPSDFAPIVSGIYVEADAVNNGGGTVTVRRITLLCEGISKDGRPTVARNDDRWFDPRYSDGYRDRVRTFEGPNVATHAEGKGKSVCPVGLAVGIHGRAGPWLNALGLICGSPEAPPVKALGRVTGHAPTGPPTPVCDAAAAARDRNSVAAPGLKAQCLAIGGRVPDPAADEVIRTAKELAATVNELAAKGEVIANSNPLSAELRNRQPVGGIRRGFDIGMAATEGQTLWGPNKQKILESLGAAEQEGFKVAASFSIDRNTNAKLAETGAAIAEADTIVAQARIRDFDVRYWLGFDIASGIFGDPALGSSGATSTGPGSLGIRDALSAPAKRGFDASAKLHLSRNYKH